MTLLTTLAHAAAALECAPSTADRIVGLFTLTNVMWTAGGIFGAVCIAVIIVQLWDIIKNIPVIAYEAIGYGLSAYCIYAATIQTGSMMHSGLLLLGSILFAGMLIFTGKARKLPENYTRFFLTLFIVWSAIAWSFQDEYVGFIAVMALMGTLGFSAGVIPGLGYWMGFEDKDALGRATAAAFVILTLFTLDHILKPPSVLHVHVFESGALWMGSFVGFLGLLIMSWGSYSRRYQWLLRQLIIIVFGFLAIGVGLTFQVPYMAKIGGTFFGLYLVEKPFELSKDSLLGTAVIGLIVCICLWVGAGWIDTHRAIIGPFLLF
jgi:hypothetical protein